MQECARIADGAEVLELVRVDDPDHGPNPPLVPRYQAPPRRPVFQTPSSTTEPVPNLTASAAPDQPAEGKRPDRTAKTVSYS
jgi:hypothetical protein